MQYVWFNFYILCFKDDPFQQKFKDIHINGKLNYIVSKILTKS